MFREAMAAPRCKWLHGRGIYLRPYVQGGVDRGSAAEIPRRHPQLRQMSYGLSQGSGAKSRTNLTSRSRRSRRRAPLSAPPASSERAEEATIMSDEPEGTEYTTEYTIAAVSKLTGISCHALRVWERRYGFPVPHRSASGHRRYSRDQVRLLRRISDLSREGHAISDLIADTCSGRLVVESAPAPDVEPVEAQVVELVDRLIAGDLEGGRACFDRLASEFEPADLITRVIGPALVDTGERWFRHECEIYQERSVTGFLCGKLEVMIEAERHANDRPTRKIIIGTVQGDRH